MTTMSLKKGLPIELMLAKRLDAGTAKEGEYVPFIVTEDVKDDAGNVAFPKGSVVDGEVTWSRSEGTLSGLAGQPARLEVKFKGLKVDESTVFPLTADVAEADKPYSFNRSNTGLPGDGADQLDDILKDEVNRQALDQIMKAFNGEDVSLDSLDTKMALEKIADRLGLTQTKEVAQSSASSWMGMNQSIKDLQKGTLLSIATGEGALAVGAVLELANLAGEVGGKITDKLKGRTIRAFPGTKVKAYLTQDQTVRKLREKPL